MNAITTTSTPRPRGCSGAPRYAGQAEGVDPAPAGMLRRPPVPARAPLRRPRARGDAPWRASATCSACPSTPRPRGCSVAGSDALGSAPVDPAPAGMLRSSATRRRSPRSRPRARGDAPSAMASSRISVAVDPAPAGMLHSGRPSATACWSRPRARGDAPYGTVLTLTNIPSTPRPRGCSRAVQRVPAADHVDPAPAGMLRRRPPRSGRA